MKYCIKYHHQYPSPLFLINLNFKGVLCFLFIIFIYFLIILISIMMIKADLSLFYWGIHTKKCSCLCTFTIDIIYGNTYFSRLLIFRGLIKWLSLRNFPLRSFHLNDFFFVVYVCNVFKCSPGWLKWHKFNIYHFIWP